MRDKPSQRPWASEAAVFVYEQEGDAATLLAEHLADEGATEIPLGDRVEGATSWRIGSRFRFRMLGLSIQSGRDSFPIRVDLVPEPGVRTGERIRITVYSDPGWYPITTSMANHFAARRVAEIMSALQGASAVDSVE